MTTIVEGPDGSSPLPLAAFLDGIRRDTDLDQLRHLRRAGKHSPAGDGLVNRKATPEEIEKMKEIAAQAMRDGAFGLSTGLFYVPGNFTPTEEVIETRQGGGRDGRHPHLAHARGGGARARQRARDHPHRRGGRTAHADHAPQDHRPGRIGARAWRRSSWSRRRAPAAWTSPSISIRTPRRAPASRRWFRNGRWKAAQKSTAERLAAPEQRARIKATIVENLKIDRGAGDPKNVAIVNCAFDRDAGRQEPGRDHAGPRRGADNGERRRDGHGPGGQGRLLGRSTTPSRRRTWCASCSRPTR